MNDTTKYDDKLGNEIAANYCDFFKGAATNAETQITNLYKDQKSKMPASITGDKRSQFTKEFARITNIVHTDTSDIISTECPFITMKKDRVAALTDFNLVKDGLIKLNTGVRETCENWDATFESNIKAHTNYLPGIYANIDNKRFGVVDFNVKGMETTLKGLSSKSPKEKLNKGWEQIMQNVKTKTKEVADKIDAAAVFAKTQVANQKISDKDKQACLTDIEKTVTESKKMLDDKNKTVEAASTAVKADFDKNPKIADTNFSAASLRSYNIASVNTKAIASDALNALYTPCQKLST